MIRKSLLTGRGLGGILNSTVPSTGSRSWSRITTCNVNIR